MAAGRGRPYDALIEITYVGGRLPDEVRDALTVTLRHGLGNQSLSVTASPDPYAVVRVRAILNGTNPLTALERLDAALDEALMGAGVFEEFDWSGRALHVAPPDRG